MFQNALYLHHFIYSSFCILISALASSSPPSFPISFIYSRTVSFACVSRKLRCHNPNKFLPPFIYSHIFSFACIFRTLRCHNRSERLPLFIYIFKYYLLHIYFQIFFFCGAATQRGSWPPHSWGFLDHTQRRTTIGRTPLDEWSARRRDLCLTTHNNHNRQTSMPPVGFEPTISAGKRPQTYALDHTATGTGIFRMLAIS